MKDLESKLAEKEAMIRVLQKHTYDKDSSTSSGVSSYPAAHSSHSSTSADHHTALTSTPELGNDFVFLFDLHMFVCMCVCVCVFFVISFLIKFFFYFFCSGQG